MKKIGLSLLICAVLIAVSSGFASDIFMINDDGTEETIDFIGATMVFDKTDEMVITGYLDDAIKQVKFGEGPMEVLETYEDNYAQDAVYDEVSDEDGNRYVACFAHNGENNDIGTIKFNPDGEIEWVHVYDSKGTDISW